MEHASAVEEAARAYFKAYEAGEDASPFVTGKLADLIKWGHVVETNYRFEGRAIELRKLEITSIDGTSAHAELDAEERVRLVFGDLDGPMSISYTGPMRLELVDGAWKVADYTMRGSSICDEFVCHEESTSAQGVELRPRVSIVRPDGVGVVFTIRNLRSSALWPSEGFLSSRIGRVKAGTLAASPTILPGEVRTLRVDFSGKLSGSMLLLIPVFDLGGRRWLHPSVQITLPRSQRP